MPPDITHKKDHLVRMVWNLAQQIEQKLSGECSGGS